MSPTSLSVVIPCHNEEGAIAELIAECFAALPEREIEVIIVDDGSQDATAARVLELAAHEPRLRLIRHARCCGQSTAIRSGVAAARHDWVATLDGDGQNPPDQIPVLIAALDIAPVARIGLVQGQRLGRRDTASKRVASRMANGLRNAVLRDGVTDSGCGLKLFRREAWLAMPFFDHIHRFTPAMMRRDGWEVLISPVNHRPRLSGRSNYSNLQRALVGVVDLLGAAWLIRRSGRPRPVHSESHAGEALLRGRD
ncbi:glycosyltransferase family 2 protein, partial [Paracoccus sp. MBLB3053]